MIIDTHMHWPMSLDNNAAHFVEVLDRYHIDHAVLSGWRVLFKTERAPYWNDVLARFRRAAPDRITGLATVYLADDAAVVEARRCLETLDLKGFKIHPWLQGETLACSTMDGLCDVAGEFDVPIMFHDGTPSYAMPGQVGLLAARFPQTTFVLGHSGILHYWEEALQVACRYDNVYLTLCGGHPRAFQRFCDTVDTDRILFGTDYVGPGAEEFIAYRMGLVERLELPDDTRRKIMADNARGLYRIDTEGTQ